MKTFANRRWHSAMLSLAVLVGIVFWLRWRESSLAPTAFDTGYLLLGALCFLSLYNLRKKLPSLPLITSAGWMQTHLYVGLLAVAVFFLHTGLRWPNGTLETLLAVLFLLVSVSGLVGLYWTRTVPPRLARVGEEFLYERIPMLRAALRDRANHTVLAAVRSSGATTLGEFYANRLNNYFSRPRGIGYYLRPSNRVRRRLMAELTDMARYLSDDECKASEDLFALVRKRDDLDYHSALQGRLKWWLFVHIGLTYPLLLLACLHGLLAHTFYGGVP